MTNLRRVNHVVAIEKDVRKRSHSTLTEAYQTAAKPMLYNGFIKKYTPRNEDDEKLPEERQLVQINARNQIAAVETNLRDLFNITAEKDFSNCKARADIVLDGNILMHKVPITFLLFIEKQLADLRTYINTIPILDPSEKWEFNKDSNMYLSEEQETFRTKKLQRPIVLFPATDKHPAQTQLITDDVVVGTWKGRKMSGCISQEDKTKYLMRIEKLMTAVVGARETANMEPSEPQDTSTLFNAIFR